MLLMSKNTSDISSVFIAWIAWLVASDRIDFFEYEVKISFILLIFLAWLAASDMAQLEQKWDP